MNLNVSVEIKGAEVIIRSLERVNANMGEAMKPAIVRAADTVRQYVSEYPPATAANLPSPGHTHYERGMGSVYVRKTDGKHTVRKTSEMLNRKWSTKYRFTATEAEAIVGNSASYAPYVHDDRKQAAFHARRNWRTVQQAITVNRDKIRQFFEQAVRDAVQRSNL
jgi:hypothetical protein